MKHQNRLLVVITLLAVMVGAWYIPSFVRKATNDYQRFPLVYYSSVLKELAILDFADKKYPMTTISGGKYTETQADSLIPMFFYRQLLQDGRMPDSIRGIEMTMRNIRSKTTMYKFTPNMVDAPLLGLYIMLETMPLRGGLTMPTDFFRIKNRIEFIEASTNKVNQKKSDIFNNELLKRGYKFPTQWAAGNPSVRKPYDDGYFCLDSNNKLFHVKMVNGRPYIRDCKIPENIDIAYFSSETPSDKRFYGVLHTSNGEMYLLGDKYKLQKLDIPNIDLTSDQVNIMGNMFYWNVSVTTPKGKYTYALDANTLEQVDKYFIAKEYSTWDKLSPYLFPVRISFESSNNDYIYPRFILGNYWAFIISLVLAILFSLRVKNATRCEMIFRFLVIISTGIIGALVVNILPRFRQKINN